MKQLGMAGEEYIQPVFGRDSEVAFLACVCLGDGIVGAGERNTCFRERCLRCSINHAARRAVCAYVADWQTTRAQDAHRQNDNQQGPSEHCWIHGWRKNVFCGDADINGSLRTAVILSSACYSPGAHSLVSGGVCFHALILVHEAAKVLIERICCLIDRSDQAQKRGLGIISPTSIQLASVEGLTFHLANP